MYHDPEHEDYDDDDYKFFPEYKSSEPFKFDWTAWEEWLKDAIDELQSDNNGEWVVHYTTADNQQKQNQDSFDDLTQKFIYFGQNNYDECIWKTKYFIANYFNTSYKNHFMSNAAHILKQPAYYRGLFDMLN